MRQSLSETTRRPAVAPGGVSHRNGAGAGLLLGALALSAALAGAAFVDQAGGRSLMDHAHDVYAGHGASPSAGVVYGLVYTVAALGVLLWLGTLAGARAGRRWAVWAAVVVTVVMAGLAVTLLAASEYGEQVYPPFWGILALLSPLVGALAVVPLAMRRARQD